MIFQYPQQSPTRARGADETAPILSLDQATRSTVIPTEHFWRDKRQKAQWRNLLFCPRPAYDIFIIRALTSEKPMPKRFRVF
ncbi:MAG TPA: hypothetical protein VND65_06970, partial [Candidatus Binatia bacterium]|nr:hypothetical protein [Candidatus Binatia bacterium]